MNVEECGRGINFKCHFRYLERVGVLIKKLKKLKWAVMESCCDYSEKVWYCAQTKSY